MKYGLVTFLFLIFVSLGYSQDGQVPDSVEINALTKLYEATNGDDWADNKNWLKENKWPDWEGVTYLDGDVIELDLRSNKLEGELPEEFYDLIAMEELDLTRNQLSGEISKKVGQMVNLQFLLLDRNELTGEIPEEIGLLANLEELGLFDNQLSGEVPGTLGNLSQLKQLYLGVNSFSGELPNSLANLRDLEVFNIVDNVFQGQLPAFIGNYTYLFDLSLDYNLFTGEIPDSFQNLTYLEYFSVTGNQLIGAVPQYIVEFPDIYGLWINGNQFYEIPDFSTHPDPMSLLVEMERNKLDFGDLEPNWASEGSILRNPGFTPQDSVITLFSPSQNTYSVEVGGQYNRYQWFKNGTEIPGATLPSFTTSLSDNNGKEVYQCRITNTLVSGLELWSETKITRSGKYYTVKDGNWKDLIWSREKGGQVTDTSPGEGSEVYIVGRHITVTDDVTTGSIHVIVENASASLTVDDAEVTVVGTLELVKETEGYNGDVMVVNGGKIIPLDE